jgi:enoyl-CoA hydratase/carnithine racemase
MDMKDDDVQEREPSGVHADDLKLTPLNNGIWTPVIVAVNGLCVGAGLHFLCDADVIIASDNSTFLDTHAMVGQVAALEPIGLIPRIGLGAVLRMVVLGRAGRLTATDALRVGLVDEVIEADGLMTRAMELAFAVAEASPTTLVRSKQVIWESLERPMSEALQHGWEALLAHRNHPDYEEGPLAFVEKRAPNWVTETNKH